ncbi:MAG: ABC transporter permease [Chloroflexi bacterium]|nr:ABC transporter permease [Chloroflexota bacterium]
MGSRIAAIIQKELLQIRRDRRTLAIVLVLPVMQLLLLGYAINTVVDHLPTVVYDEARDPDSRALIAAFQNSTYFDIVGSALTRNEAVAAIDGGRAKVALLIPPRFGDDVLGGRVGQVQVLVDGSDPNVAQTALMAAGMVSQAQSASINASTIERLGRRSGAGGVEMRPVVLYNPSMLSANFMIPGIIGMIMQFQTLILTAFAVVRERERGTLEQLIVTPIRPWELMLGKLLPYTGIAFIGATVALAAGWVLFGVEVAGSLPLLAALSVLFLIGSLGLGLLISTVSQTQGQAMQLAIFILLPTVLLSGFVFPRETMPWIVQQLGQVIPLTWYLQILRGIILKGVGFDVLWTSALPLAILSVTVFTLSAMRFQKRVG